jgi:hypothetical protein
MSSYFSEMIQNLRQNEEITLYANLLVISDSEALQVCKFLEKEYARESAGYPYSPPAFDASAALWAAKTVYVSAQLILYRENKVAELGALLPDHQGGKGPSAILSADLCLRFLPPMILQLKMIDSADPLIEALEKILTHWHYSGVSYSPDLKIEGFDEISGNSCLQQLYINRILEYKKTQLAKHPAFKEVVLGNLSIFAPELWNEFIIANTLDE